MHDNSSLDSYRRCPRSYYYRHVRHLAAEGSKPSLAFGGSWGSAMDAVWAVMLQERGTQKQAYEAGCDAFMKSWTDDYGMPRELAAYEAEELSPRLPNTAFGMLSEYIPQRGQFWSADTELIAAELPFKVPLGSGHYVGLLDKLIRHRGQVLAVEHKTSSLYSKGDVFRSTYVDQWGMSSQIDGYLYALSHMYPGEKTAVWVDAALVHKTVRGFKIIPIEKQPDALRAWIYDTTEWSGLVSIDAQREAISRKAATAAVMQSFPKNTTGCYAYNTACQYMDLCKAWHNPQKHDAVPAGFREEVWEPLKRGKAEPVEII